MMTDETFYVVDFIWPDKESDREALDVAIEQAEFLDHIVYATTSLQPNTFEDTAYDEYLLADEMSVRHLHGLCMAHNVTAFSVYKCSVVAVDADTLQPPQPYDGNAEEPTKEIPWWEDDENMTDEEREEL